MMYACDIMVWVMNVVWQNRELVHGLAIGLDEILNVFRGEQHN